MTKNEMLKQISENADCTQAQAEKVIDSFIYFLEKKLQSGESITIRNFGKFYIRPYNGRSVTTPAGQTVRINGRKVPAFKAGKHFKKACNE